MQHHQIYHLSKDAASDESRFINKITFQILNMSIHLKVGCFAYQIKAITSEKLLYLKIVISTGFETAAKLVFFYFIFKFKFIIVTKTINITTSATLT